MTRVQFRSYDGNEAQQIRDQVAELHADAYAERIATGDPFSQEEAFMRRFDTYCLRPGFDLIIAYVADDAIGQAWGWPLTAGTGWWNGLLTEPEPGFTVEDGTRTFALSEIMVRRAWTGQGIAHTLHDRLLSSRTEQRATLLVRPENTSAYNAYTRWGWTKAAELRPKLPNAPKMDALILDLRRGVTIAGEIVTAQHEQAEHEPQPGRRPIS